MIEAKKNITIIRIEDPEQTRFDIRTPVTNFVFEALENRAHLVRPAGHPRITQAGWERMMDIVITVSFRKEPGFNRDPLERSLPLGEVGKMFPTNNKALSFEAVRQLYNKGVEYLWQNSPDPLKEKYPWEDLNYRLHHHLVHPGFMIDKKGITRKIAGAVLLGATYEDLINQGFKGHLHVARTILADYDITIPYKNESDYPQFIQELKTLTGLESKEEIQKVLNRINFSFYMKLKEEFKTYCLTITDLCKKVGLHVLGRTSNSLILQVLNDLSIPYGEILHEVKAGKQKGLKRINFILVVQGPKAMAGLTKDERLKHFRENPVSQISGEKLDQLPTTSQLSGKKEYEGLGILLEKLGLPRIAGRNKITPQQWLEGCTLTVLRTKHSGEHDKYNYYYSTDQEEQLGVFLKQKYEQLRANLYPH